MTPPFKDLFISYGRRESLGFVGRLHQQLKLAGYKVWFDKVNIPDGDDYQQRINHGIESAHNFIYVMAPRCLTSPYCLIELEYARWLGKRVIPLNQMVIFATDSKELADGDKKVLQDFYALYNLPDLNIQTTQDVLNRSHAVVGKTDWLDAKEKLTDKDCEALLAWAQQYENHWAKHDQPAYLETFDFPIFGESIDTLDSVVERLTAVIERQTNYVYQQTEILAKALYWQQNNQTTPNLLVGEERLTAENWLLQKFSAEEQAPCTPSALVCEFICESRKQADNRLTDIFICADLQDQAIRDAVIQSLSGYVKTCWTADRDVQSGTRYEYAIEQGIEGADNFLWFLSPTAVKSKDCQLELTHALNYHKRIIPLLVAPTAELPTAVQNLQCVDLTKVPADYDHQIDELLKILAHEQAYYQQHKMLLVRSRKWAENQRQSTLLLRGHQLELAKTWLRLNAQRQPHSPLPLHQEFITASDIAVHQRGTELFISYSRKDNDFVHQLTTQLQAAGKTIWFDQETQQNSINAAVDFEQETFKGIDEADNFIFIASPPSVASPYCQHEVDHAAVQGKRIIMLWYRPVEPAAIPAALQTVQRLDFSDPAKFETAWLELIRTLERDQAYVHQHTEILAQAQYWQHHQQATQYLLVGQERTATQDWLLTEFLPPARPPCQPTPLMCEFIGEARKNAENLTTDMFICYEDQDKTIRDTVVQSLSRYAKTCWTHDHDIQKGESYDRAIERGIEGADNLLFFISPTSVASEYCQRELAHALRYHKRIIPLLIIPTPISERPDLLRSLQYIDFTNNTCQADYDSHLNEILHILKQDQDYYKQHKVLLVRALKWQAEHQKSSFLLRGYNLDHAKMWLRLSNQRQQHQPLELHRQLIEASEAAKGQLGTEVFISYSRKDSDFARHLNTRLQEAGKTTWFDQESINSGVDFEKEILKGIESADNFVFVISPAAVASEYCEREVNYATEQNKRLISVLHREAEPKTMPTVLQKINWIDFQNEVFDQSFAELVQAIELDREHTHQHTVLQQRANDWADNNNSQDFLLNQTACQKAEVWREVAVAEQKKPVPSELQIRFIQTSREAIKKANRRKNILFSFMGILTIIAVVLSIFAFQAKQNAKQALVKAEQSEKKAKEQAQIVLLEKLGAQAIVATESPSASNGSYEHAALLAVQAFKEQDTVTSRSNLLRVLQAKAHKRVFYMAILVV
ncbi:MAG: toll/interleukin-1 receptor domain-containing protein [Thioploca sp.]|nr:toll/interleukin-1 receptor domain-containing protein [Thioploca sp.]